MKSGLATIVCGLLLATSGCTSSSSAQATGQKDGGGTGDASSGSYGSSACGTCVAQACTTPITKCNADPDCAAYLTCLDACPLGADGNVDPGCAAGCPTGSSSSGASAEAALNDCRSAGPGAQCADCGIDGGGVNPILNQMCMPMTDTTPCFTCEDNKCCDTYARCHANPDCKALQTCIVDCLQGKADDAGSPEGGATATETCSYICGLAHPTGLVDWAPRDTCIFVRCVSECDNSTPSPCVQCQNLHCANEYANLDSTPDGFLLSACIAGCPTGSPCEMACIDKYPHAMAASTALYACVNANCPACGAGD